MSYQAYLDTIKAKTGKTPDDFRILAAQKGLTKYPEVMTWLKTDFGLGHGHANVIAQLLVNADKFQASPEDKLATHFTGAKACWREAYTTLVEELARLGDDFKVAPTSSYISLLRGARKFGIIQISAANHIDIGIKLKGVAPIGRLESAGTWNNLVTHRVRISDPNQNDAEVLAWLKRAYEAAQAQYAEMD
jgi:hypothetical protein